MENILINKILDYKNESLLIITPNSIKTNILKDISQKGLFDITWMDLNSFINKLTYQINEYAEIYLMKDFGYNYDSVKTYLNQIINTLYINKNTLLDYELEKYNKVNEIFNYLQDNKLISKDDKFLNLIKNKKIFIYGYSKLTNLQTEILKDINYEFLDPLENINTINTNNIKYLYKCETVEVEFYQLAEKIAELINNNIEINDIKIINLNNLHFKTFKRVFDLYQIPVNYNELTPLWYFPITKEIVNNLFNYSIDEFNEYIKNLKEDELEILDKVIKIINPIYVLKNKFDLDLIKLVIKNKLINTYFSNKKNLNAIDIISLEEAKALNNKHLFIINFNQGSLPKVIMDEDYYTDRIKLVNKLDDTQTLNEINKLDVISVLNTNNNFYLSYLVKDDGKELSKSFILNELDLIENIKRLSYSQYANEFNKYLYTKKLDSYYKYNIKDDELLLLNVTYKDDVLYREYENKFTGISRTVLDSIINDNINLSYTSIDTYNKCAFRYYVEKILKIDIHENDFSSYRGSLFHYVLSQMYDENFDYLVSTQEFIKNNPFELSSKEKMILDNLIEEIPFIIETIKEQEEEINYQEHLLEANFNNDKKSDKYEYNLHLTGYIDKILYKQIKNELDEVLKTYLIVLDYKTYEPTIDLRLIPYGLSLQLLVYYHLIKNDEKLKNPTLGGFYIQPILALNVNEEDELSYTEAKKKQLQLAGYTNVGLPTEGAFLKDINCKKVVKNLALKKSDDESKIEFYTNSKIIDNKKIDELMIEVKKQIDKTADNIYLGNFDINPKSYSSVKKPTKKEIEEGIKITSFTTSQNIGCEFCKFHDICYMTNDNLVEIKGGEDNEQNKVE